ncbi:natural cytotoxicity triggering receptor 3 isoform X1 [Sturnira hondurensis]|uniref:natural cytotoxicity triggering receptor 3 isoform X1 n=1 Tax=Sturnira hondurensis TaxID=192404 RepID=UPI00187A7240|nr:natural cytotoxicity triggering receptor 3 isoform X1 [Sturnira hondurensis]XP_036902693.1 natural cytotoxicity triggering receptor 3 isoform X1 [Sturnira hondurensis]
MSSGTAQMLLLIFIVVHPESCALRVSQPPEIRTQEGAAALLPCSFNASQGRLAIGSVMWYRDKVAPGKEVRNRTPEFRGRLAPLAPSRFLCDHQAELQIWDTRGSDAGIYVCSVEVLGLGVGTGNGTLLVVEKGPPGLGARTVLLLRAGFYAFSFLSVAMGSTIYYQGKCELWSHSNGRDGGAVRELERGRQRSGRELTLAMSPPGHCHMGTHCHSLDGLC